MVRALLIRGMLAGVVAGLLVFAFARLFGEPQVDRAIAFETAMEAAKPAGQNAAAPHDHGTAAPHDHGAGVMHQHGGSESASHEHEDLVSRPMQAGIGLFTGVVVYAAAFGGLFGLVFAAADRRLVDLGPRAGAALLAVAAFVAVYLVPNLKYPANPPAVGDADTIRLRTALYFIMLGLSVAAMIGAAVLRTRLAPRFGGWTAALLASGGYIVAMAILAIVLPSLNEVPEGFPAALLWDFRVAAFGMQAIMWATIGLVFGASAEQVLAIYEGQRIPVRSTAFDGLRKA